MRRSVAVLVSVALVLTVWLPSAAAEARVDADERTTGPSQGSGWGGNTNPSESIQSTRAKDRVSRPLPVVRRITPNAGPLGERTKVTIYGRHFGERSTVRFGSFKVHAQVKSPRRITAVTSLRVATAKPVAVTVRSRGKTSKVTSRTWFTYQDAPDDGSVSVDVSPDEDVTLHATPNLDIEVPAGAAGGASATLSYTPEPSLVGEVETGFQFDAYGDVHLSSGQPVLPLTFVWTFDSPLPSGEDAAFYTGTPDSPTFRKLPTTLSADRHTATAQVSSLSFKGVLTWVTDRAENFVGHVLSDRGERPTCANDADGQFNEDVPGWVTDTTFVDKDRQLVDNALLACVGHDPADPDVFVAKFTNNRGHGITVNVPADWEWMYISDPDGLGDAVYELWSMLHNGSERKIPLSPGQQLHLGFSKKSLNGATSITIQAEVDQAAVIYGLILTAVKEALGQVRGLPVLSAAMVANCLVSPGPIPRIDDWVGLLQAFWDRIPCFTDENAIDTLIGSAMNDPLGPDWNWLKDPTTFDKIVKKFNIYVLALSGTQRGLEIAFDSLLDPAAYALSAWFEYVPPKCLNWQDQDTPLAITTGQYTWYGISDTEPWNFPSLSSYAGRIDFSDGTSLATQLGGGPYRHTWNTPGTYTAHITGDGFRSDLGRACHDDATYTVIVKPPDTMYVNQPLQRGDFLRSSDGRYTLHVQAGDGNVVLYNSAGVAIWTTHRPGGQYLILQEDGNLVEYTASGQALWASSTVGRGAARLVVQSDGNMVLYRADNGVVWATNTVGR